MPRVEIPSQLRGLSGGEQFISVQSRTVRTLLQELDTRFPGIAEQLRTTTTVSIDGEVLGDSMSDAILQPIPADGEVYFVPAISGG
jgi:molybdopterin converting factor small subunit